MSDRLSVTFEQLPGLVGRELGPTSSRRLTQRDVDAFAALTGDLQWIHTDPRRAAGQGGTIVHGLLVLGLVGGFSGDLLEVAGCSRTLNYGLDRVRFVRPVPVGSGVRMRATVADVGERPDGLKVSLAISLEVAGSDGPAVVATSIVLFQR